MEVEDSLRLIANARLIVSRVKGTFIDLLVWYNSSSIMNIINLSHITKSYRVLLDTSEDKAIYVEMNKRK